MSTTNVTIRLYSQLKSQAEALFSELGLNLSTAFRIFLRQSLKLRYSESSSTLYAVEVLI